MELGNLLIAAGGVLVAIASAAISVVVVNRAARKERADEVAATTAALHKLELTLTDLDGKHTALRRDHDTMQGELAREFDSVTTSQGDQFALLREIQRDIAENKTAVAAATATLVALAESFRRQHEREIHKQ